MRANWAVLTANGERPKPERAGPGGGRPRVAAQPHEEERRGRGDAEQRGEAGRGQGVAEQAQATGDDPGLGERAGVEPVGDARLAGGEQALGRDDLVQLVRVRRPVEADRVDERRGGGQQQRHRPGGRDAAGGGRGDGGCGQGSAHRAQRGNGPRSGARRPLSRAAPPENSALTPPPGGEAVTVGLGGPAPALREWPARRRRARAAAPAARSPPSRPAAWWRPGDQA